MRVARWVVIGGALVLGVLGGCVSGESENEVRYVICYEENAGRWTEVETCVRKCEDSKGYSANCVADCPGARAESGSCYSRPSCDGYCAS